MTEAMLAQARSAALERSFEGWTSHDGPPAIQGPKNGEDATEPLLRLVKQASKSGADGIIIGCFDDTALSEAVACAGQVGGGNVGGRAPIVNGETHANGLVEVEVHHPDDALIEWEQNYGHNKWVIQYNP